MDTFLWFYILLTRLLFGHPRQLRRILDTWKWGRQEKLCKYAWILLTFRTLFPSPPFLEIMHFSLARASNSTHLNSPHKTKAVPLLYISVSLTPLHSFDFSYGRIVSFLSYKNLIFFFSPSSKKGPSLASEQSLWECSGKLHSQDKSTIRFNLI